MLRDPLLPGVEVLQAHFLRYQYTPHWQGSRRHCRPAQGTDAPRSRMLPRLGRPERRTPLRAYEIHTGEPATSAGLDYRVLYVNSERAADLLEDVHAELAVRAPTEVVHRRTAAAEPLAWFHRAMAGNALMLERELALLAGVVAVASEFGGVQRRDPAVPEHRAVRRAREYLHAHPTDPITLRDLADVAGLSMYRLARTFGAEVGMPPHAYQVQLRVLKAKRLLSAVTRSAPPPLYAASTTKRT
jgi:AraC-like DNA-binding protein